MVDIAALVHELNNAANKAALCRDIGDYFGATFWEGRCREIDDAIIISDRREKAPWARSHQDEVRWPRSDA